MNYIAEMTRDIAKGVAIRYEQKIAVCIKPKPRLLTQKMWLKLASIFIYVEKTQPSMTIATKSGKKIK